MRVVDLRQGTGCRLVDRVTPTRVVDRQDPVRLNAGVESLQHRPLGRVGDDEIAVDASDVGSESGAPASRVDTDDRGPAQRGAAEKEDVVGNVLEQDSDVKRAAGPPEAVQQGGSGLALGHHLGPGVTDVLEQ